MKYRKEIRLSLRPQVWDLINTEMQRQLKVTSVAYGVRVILYLWMKKYGHQLDHDLEHVSHEASIAGGSTPVIDHVLRRCRRCKQTYHYREMHFKFPTVCNACVEKLARQGNTRPGKTTEELADLYHRRVCTREYRAMYEKGMDLPSWQQWFKQQAHRKQKHREEYYRNR